MYQVNTHAMFSKIADGMAVRGINGDSVGTVKEVHFGEENFAEPGSRSAGAARPEDRSFGFLDTLARVFSAKADLPEVVRNRMRQYGFIRIDPGLGGDYFALGDQIDFVSSDAVHLKVTGDELLKQ